METRGCELLFLPASSPDFWPSEEAFSKVKTLFRRERAGTREALTEAIGRALEAVSGWEGQGWFVHCGYTLRDHLP